MDPVLKAALENPRIARRWSVRDDHDDGTRRRRKAVKRVAAQKAPPAMPRPGKAPSGRCGASGP
jgi:hypothetical protein